MSKKKPITPRFGPFFAAFRGETDRAAGVLAAAYLEASLERLFRARLLDDSPDEIFAFRGSLGDLSGKIDLAFALGWISMDSRNDLHIIRGIRNAFAHDCDHTLSFDEESIAARTLNLRAKSRVRDFLTEAFSNLPETLRDEAVAGLLDDMFATSRTRFESAVAHLEVLLSNAIKNSSRPTAFVDSSRVVPLTDWTVAPGETVEIDFQEGSMRIVSDHSAT